MPPRILELAAGAARLRLSPTAGGRVTSLRLAPCGADAARELLHRFPEETGPDALRHWPKGGIYPLIPYGNRIRDGRLVLAHSTEILPPHPDAAPHTLHGLAHRVPWMVAAQGGNRAELALHHVGRGEWPWRFTAVQEFRLQADRLHIGLTLRNEDERPMPAGLGLHPYLLHRPDDRIGFRAATDWPLTAELLGGPPVPAPPDHETPCPLPEGTVTRYRGGWNGECTVEGPGGRVVLTAGPAFGHLVVHRPGAANYICVEPSTHAPDGFNLQEVGVAGAGRVMLPPGGALRGEVTIALLGDP